MILSEIVCLSLFICGLYLVTHGYLIDLNKFEDKIVNEKWFFITKPIFSCVTCMASFWTLFYELAFVGSIDIYVIPTIFSVAFLNTLIWHVYSYLR